MGGPGEVRREPKAADGTAPGARPLLRLRLFVAGNAPNSLQARANLRTLLRHCGIHDVDLEIVDCLLEPLRALEEGVFVTPTLLKLAPLPGGIIVGTLAGAERVAQALGIELNPSTEAADD